MASNVLCEDARYGRSKQNALRPYIGLTTNCPLFGEAKLPIKSVPVMIADDVTSLPLETLASVLDQSTDCVKLIGLDGRLQYMNYNGQCAMEVDDFGRLKGLLWSDLWPDEARGQIEASLTAAAAGDIARFTAFCPTGKAMPKWWHVTVSPVVDGAGNHSAYLSVSRDVSETELARQAAVVAAAEMRHRLKNSYTMIASLMRNFARGDDALEAFASEMTDRMISLGAAQTLFADKEGAPCKLADLIPALVEPFESPDCPIVVGSIGDRDVAQGQADAIALVIGELAVNAAKHGATFSGGTIHVSVDERDDMIMIRWKERSNRRTDVRLRDGGQGLKLMERIMAARRGTLVLDWTDAGLDVTMSFGSATLSN